MQISVWWVSLVSLTACVDCYRILGIFPLPRANYFVIFEKLMQGLVAKGHEVDVVSHFPRKTPVTRYNDISLKNELPSNLHNLSLSVIESFDMFETANYIFKDYGTDICESVLRLPVMENLRRSNVKYDVMITELFGSDCLLGFSYVFKIPIIGVISDVMVPWASDRMGNPDNPSYIPNYLLPYGSKMHLQNRLLNAFSELMYKIGYQALSLIPSEMKARTFFGPKMTPLDILAYNTSLVLVNSHFSSHFPRPMVPGVVEVAGLHIGKTKPLPKSATSFLKPNKPVIYVSLQMEMFNKKQIVDIIKCLGEAEHQVIWNVNVNDIPGTVPKNIYTNDSAFENLDALCHSQTALFITHGDVMVLQEAMHCGVPIIGIPLVAEHGIYIRDYETRGLAVQMQIEDVDRASLSKAIQSILTNTTYKSSARFQSALFRDRPLKPLDTALYWVEYVIRHAGASHLRSVGADLLWLEYYLIDVVIACIGTFILFVLFGLILVKLAQTYIEKRQKTLPSEQKEKQK